MSAPTNASPTLLLGGYPTNSSLVPSIIFCLLYIVLVPVVLWRICSPSSRCMTLVRPTLFVIMRIVFFALRAYQSKGHYGETMFIIEQVFLLVGFVFLADPLIQAFKNMIALHTAPGEGSLLQTMATVLRLALLGVVITGVIAATDFSDAVDNPNGSDAKDLKTLRLVNYILCLVVVAALIFGTFMAKASYPIDNFGLLVIPLGALALGVTALFKLANSEIKNANDWVHTNTAFFIFVVTFEYIACCIVLAINFPQRFPVIQRNGGPPGMFGGRFNYNGGGGNGGNAGGNEFGIDQAGYKQQAYPPQVYQSTRPGYQA